MCLGGSGTAGHPSISIPQVDGQEVQAAVPFLDLANPRPPAALAHTVTRDGGSSGDAGGGGDGAGSGGFFELLSDQVYAPQGRRCLSTMGRRITGRLLLAAWDSLEPGRLRAFITSCRPAAAPGECGAESASM
jgi:hypothetical protein